MKEAVRHVLVTGSASGIGKAVSGLLSDQGHHVIGVDLANAEICADLGEAAGRDQVIAALREEAIIPDAAILCAGISRPNDGASVVSVNFFGATGLLQRLRPLLARGRDPRVVLLSSIASLFPVCQETVDLCLAGDEEAARRAAAPNGDIAYASSKRALTQWVRRHAPLAEWAGAGILLNGVAPGTIRTPMALPLLADPEGARMLAQAVPLAVGDYAEPEDIAPLIAFLASAQNRFLIGQMPFVDGGSDVLIRGDAPL